MDGGKCWENRTPTKSDYCKDGNVEKDLKGRVKQHLKYSKRDSLCTRRKDGLVEYIFVGVEWFNWKRWNAAHEGYGVAILQIYFAVDGAVERDKS